MKEVIHYIRQKIITRLNGNVSLGGNNVPVYNRVPSTQDEPYIIVYSNDDGEIYNFPKGKRPRFEINDIFNKQKHNTIKTNMNRRKTK